MSTICIRTSITIYWITCSIYTIVYITNVVFLKTWKDIYSVNKQGLWYVFVLVALVSDFLLSQGLYFLKRRVHKKALEEEQSHTR